MIDLRKLSMLEGLDRLGTIAAVADELFLTASGVSMQLAAFEREVGVQLTERQGRRLALTPAGRLLATQGRGLLDQLSIAEEELASLRRGRSGSYRLAAFPSAAKTFVADAWAELRDSALRLSLQTPEPEGAIDQLLRGEVDLAVIHSYSNVPRELPAGLETELLGAEPIWLALPQADPLAGPQVELSTLQDRDWLAPLPGYTCYEMTERACGLAGFRPTVIAHSMDFDAQLALVGAGVGVALIPALAAGTVPDGVMLARPEPSLRRLVHVARRSGLHGEPGLDRIVASLRGTLADRLSREPTAVE